MRGLPAGWYLDPARGPLDVARLLAPAWQFVCHVADLPAPGTAARFDCGGRSAFVIRTRSMELRAFRNACSHRASRLVDGDRATGFAYCVDGRVRCPYHGWTYDGQGQLESVPAGQRFAELDAADTALPEYAVGEWRGLVFLALDPPARPLSEAFDPIGDWPDVSSMRRLAEPRVVTVEADWKLACEHALDSAHVGIARPMPVSRLFEHAGYAAAGPDAWRAAGGVPVDPSRASWSARRYFALAAEGTASGIAPADWAYLWPNQSLCRIGDTVTVRQALPAGTGRCWIRLLHYGPPPGTRRDRALRHLHERTSRGALADDARLLERVQHGLSSLDAQATLPLDEAQPALAAFVGRCRAAFETMPGTAAPRRARRPRKTVMSAPA